MNIEKLKSKQIIETYIQSVDKWIDVIEKYSEEEYYWKPDSKQWSISEIVSHLIATANICTQKSIDCSNALGGKRKAGIKTKLFSMMDSFPPIRIEIKEIPEGLESMYNPRELSKEDAKKGLIATIDLMKKAESMLSSADENTRIEHWAAGDFNAFQWFKSIEMHIRHHFRQKERIDKLLNK